MTRITNFKETKVWQEARALVNQIYKVTNDGLFSKDFALRDQIRRAAISVMANIAEGFTCSSNNEFVRFLIYSRRSTTEVESHLCIALDQNYLLDKEFKKINEQTTKVNKLINGFIRYLRESTNQLTNKSTNQLTNKSTNQRRNGFTLIEIIMAMAILAVGIIGVVRLIPVGLRASKTSEMMSKAAFLAQEKLEELKLAGFSELSAPNPSVPLEGEQGDYTWTAEVSELALEGVNNPEDMRSLSLTVSWQEKGKTRSQEFVTYITK